MSAPFSTSTVDQKIAFFFLPPEGPAPSVAGTPGQISVLHWLRREVQQCLFEVQSGHQPPFAETTAIQMLQDPMQLVHRIFASSMIIFAGIDLLAKFHDGRIQDPSTGKVTFSKSSVAARFTTFLETYCSITPDDAKAIYAIRNSIMHSFGLFVDPPLQIGIASISRIRFTHDMTSSLRAVDIQGAQATVQLRPLYDIFVQSIATYHKKLCSPQDPQYTYLRQKFESVFADYGYINYVP